MVRSHYDPPDQKSTDELSAFFVPSASGESRPVGMGRAHHVLRLPTLGGAAMGVNGVVLIRELARMDFLTIRGQAGCFTGLSIAVDSQTLTLP